MTSTLAAFSPDQGVALVYARPEMRPKFEALLRLDLELAAAVSAASEPLPGQVRLAWWRDMLGSLTRAQSARVPLVDNLIGIGNYAVIGPCLVAMVNGWETLLSPFPISAASLIDYAEGRGGGIFSAAARVSGHPANHPANAGIGWALADFAFRCSDVETATTALALARERLSILPPMPKSMRPFALLARFARTDSLRSLEQGSAAESPSRLIDTAKLVLTGK